MKPGLTVFVLAKDAEKDLKECLAVARPIVDDIVVVVDSASTDSTADVARSFTPRVWVNPFEGFSAMKQFALMKCETEWALNLDTDERLSPELLWEIDRVKKSPDPSVNGYFLNRLPYFLGKPIYHGGWYPDWIMRLVKPSLAAYPLRPVHERLEVSGKTSRLAGHLLHYTVTDWNRFLDKQRRFASLAPVDPSIFSACSHAPAVFLKSIVLQAGFLDGWRGFAVAWARAYAVYHKYNRKK